MPTQYTITPEAQGVNGWGSRFSTNSYTVTLGAGTEATVTVPSSTSMGTPMAKVYNKWLARVTVEAGKKVYIALNATAAVPAGATLAASTSELLPIQSAWFVKAGDVIHIIGAAAADVSIAFFALQTG